MLGERYLPHPVLVVTADGHPVPALTYVSHEMEADVPDDAYVDLIAAAAGDYGFPEWYVAHIEAAREARTAA